MRNAAIWILVITSLACDSVEPIDRLADTYVDLLRYRDRTEQPDSSMIQTGIDSILATHGFTPAAYRSAFASLADDPDHLPAFFARVEVRMAATNPALTKTP